MTLQPVLANLAIKADVTLATEILASLPGCEVTARHEALGQPFVEARVGETTVNVFGRALYETAAAPIVGGMLHASFWVESLGDALASPAWAAALTVPPQTIEGGFGRRRIAFFEPLPGVRIELMEDIDG